MSAKKTITVVERVTVFEKQTRLVCSEPPRSTHPTAFDNKN